MMRKKLGLALKLAAVGVIGLFVFTALRTPSLDRVWDEDVRVLAGVNVPDGGPIEFTDVRDWRYSRDSVVSKSWFDASYDPDDIVDLWMYEQQLDGRGLIAHTFVVFEFADSEGGRNYLGLSVETRREEGEEYSLLGGAMRAFEVTHIWATERDLVRRRVEYLDYPLTRYRLDIPPEYRARIFAKFAQETHGLATIPRWYNTLLNNCTSSLIRYVNESEPDAIPLHYSYVLTGKTDEYLDRLGYLDRSSSVRIDRAYLSENEVR